MSVRHLSTSAAAAVLGVAGLALGALALSRSRRGVAA